MKSLENSLKVIRDGCFEAQLRMKSRMLDDHFSTCQKEPTKTKPAFKKTIVPSDPIVNVPYNWMTNTAQVAPDLMLPTC